MPVKGPNLGAGLVKMARKIEDETKETVKASATLAKGVQLKKIRSDSGGDGKLSGVNKAKGRPGDTAVGARYRVEARGSSAQAFLFATGPLQIINNDTVGRVIRSTYSFGNGRKGLIGPAAPGQFTARKGRMIGPVLTNQAVLNIPGVGFRKSARHPGTKGKQTWQQGRKTAEPVIRSSMSKRTQNIIKGAARL